MKQRNSLNEWNKTIEQLSPSNETIDKHDEEILRKLKEKTRDIYVKSLEEQGRTHRMAEVLGTLVKFQVFCDKYRHIFEQYQKYTPKILPLDQ